MNDYNNCYGNFIKKIREKRNISQEELAKHLNISVGKVKKIEKGKLILNPSFLSRLCHYLKIDMNNLFNCSEKNDKSDDAMFSYSLELYNSQRKKKIIQLFVLIVFLCLLIGSGICFYFYNKVNVYSLSGESSKFIYSNGVFVKSNFKDIYVYGNIYPKDENILPEDIEKITIKCGSYKCNNRLIIRTDELPTMSIEDVGYNELFPKHVVDNLDAWIIEIVYRVHGTDKTQNDYINIKFENLMVKNDVEPISENEN